jgi:hypothetical protein
LAKNEKVSGVGSLVVGDVPTRLSLRSFTEQSLDGSSNDSLSQNDVRLLAWPGLLLQEYIRLQAALGLAMKHVDRRNFIT